MKEVKFFQKKRYKYGNFSNSDTRKTEKKSIIINGKITLIPDEYFISLFGFKGFGAGHF